MQKHIDGSKYVITFDALDGDYQKMLDPKQRTFYFNLIGSLFKAIDEIRNDINIDGRNVLPIAFLRDDIFVQLADSDRNKWEDVILRLEWGRDSLQRLIAHRISRAAGYSGETLPFEEAWLNRAMIAKNPSRNAACRVL